VSSEDASAKKTGISSVNAERRSSTNWERGMNWEAMQVALEKIRIGYVSGRLVHEKNVLLWMIDQLHKIQAEMNHRHEVEDERKEVR
jgi:hypothetical protein